MVSSQHPRRAVLLRIRRAGAGSHLYDLFLGRESDLGERPKFRKLTSCLQKQFRIVLPISSISHLDLTVPASSDASSTSLLDDLEFPTEMTIHLSGSPLFFIRSAGPFERHIGSSTIDSLGWIRSDDFTNVTGSRLVGGTMIQHKISLNVSLERQEERMGELIRFVHGVTGYLMELENWFMPRFDNHRISPVHYSSPTHSEHSINTAHHSTSDSTASSSRRNSQFSFGSHNSSLHSYTILPTPPPHESSSPIDCQPTEPVAAGKGLGLIVEGTHYQFPSTPVRYTQLPADDHYDSLHPPVVKGRSKSLGDHFTAARRLEDVFEENLHTRRVRATTLDSAAPPLVPFDLLPPIDLDLQESTRRNFKKEKIAGLKSSYDHHRSPSSWLPLPN